MFLKPITSWLIYHIILYHIISNHIFGVMAVISLTSILGFPKGRSVRSVISVIKLCHVFPHPPTHLRHVWIRPTFQFPSIFTCASCTHFKFEEHGKKVIVKSPLLMSIRWKFLLLQFDTLALPISNRYLRAQQKNWDFIAKISNTSYLQ